MSEDHEYVFLPAKDRCRVCDRPLAPPHLVCDECCRREREADEQEDDFNRAFEDESAVTRWKDYERGPEPDGVAGGSARRVARRKHRASVKSPAHKILGSDGNG